MIIFWRRRVRQRKQKDQIQHPSMLTGSSLYLQGLAIPKPTVTYTKPRKVVLQSGMKILACRDIGVSSYQPTRMRQP